MTDPVFDYYPRGTPLFLSDAMETATHEALSAGRPAGGALDAIEDAQVRQLERDPAFRDRMREAYATAGVNLVSPTMGSLDPATPFRDGVRQDVARWQARVDAVEWFERVTTPAEARAVTDRGDVGVVPNVQNLGAAIGGDVDEVDVLYNAGVRIGQLTYNSQNDLGHGCTERVDAGLSNLGIEAVERMNDLGMVVDLSHCGRETTLDGIAVSEAPAAVTHSFPRAVSAHDRGKSETELAALADADGYMGILAVPFFLDPGNSDADFGLFFDAVEHAVDRLGVDRVGVGTDWGSWTPELPEPLREGILRSFQGMGFREEHGVDIGVGYGPMQAYEDWGVIPEGLRERGFTDEEVGGLLGENVLDYWARVVG